MGAVLWVQVPSKGGHPDRSEPQLREGDRAWEGNDAQTTWQKLFAQNGQTYRNAKLVLFTGATNTGCGTGEAQTGPFYCPVDERVYIDLAFYNELAERFGAKGDLSGAIHPETWTHGSAEARALVPEWFRRRHAASVRHMQGRAASPTSARPSSGCERIP